MGTQSIDLDQRKTMGLCEGRNAYAAHHAAIVVEELADRGNLRQPGEGA